MAFTLSMLAVFGYESGTILYTTWYYLDASIACYSLGREACPCAWKVQYRRVTMSLLLLNENCTVTIAHSKTENLNELVAEALWYWGVGVSLIMKKLSKVRLS